MPRTHESKTENKKTPEEKQRDDTPIPDEKESVESKAIVLDDLGDACERAKDYVTARHHYEQALTLRKQLYQDRPHEEIINSLNNLGQVCFNLNEYLVARDYYAQALAMGLALYGKEPNNSVVNSLVGLGNTCLFLKDYPAARNYRQQSLDMFKLIYLDQPHEDMLDALEGMGNALEVVGDYSGALTYYKQALEMLIKLHGEKPRDKTVDLLVKMGNICGLKLNDFLIARDYYTSAFIAHTKLYGDVPDDTTVGLLCLLGAVYRRLGDFPAARDSFDKAQALVDGGKIYGENPHIRIAYLFDGKGDLCCDLGKYLDARNCYEQAYAMYKRISGADTTLIIHLLRRLGNVHRDLNDFQTAHDYYEQALAMHKHLDCVEPHEDNARLLNDLGIECMFSEGCSEALHYFNKALAMNKQIYGDKPHEHIATCLLNIGRVAEALGDYATARSRYEEAFKMYKQLYGELPQDQIVTALGQLGKVCEKLEDYGAAHNYFQHLLLILQRGINRGLPPQHHHIAEQRDSVSEFYWDWSCRFRVQANSSEQTKIIGSEFKEDPSIKPIPTSSAQCLDYARELLEAQLTVDDEILKKHGDSLQDNDFHRYHLLLYKLARVYQAQGQGVKAGLLYAERVQTLVKDHPLLQESFAKEAIHYLRPYPQHRHAVAQLYFQRAQLAYQQQPMPIYNLALRYLDHAIALQADDLWLKTRIAWQHERSQWLQRLDEDIYAQLQYAMSNYYAIRLQLMHEIDGEGIPGLSLSRGHFGLLGETFGRQRLASLSDRLKNSVTQLIVKLNNILDNAFGRLVRQGIYVPNNSKKSIIYFQVEGTLPGYNLNLEQKEILTPRDNEFKETVLGRFPKANLNWQKCLMVIASGGNSKIANSCLSVKFLQDVIAHYGEILCVIEHCRGKKIDWGELKKFDMDKLTPLLQSRELAHLKNPVIKEDYRVDDSTNGENDVLCRAKVLLEELVLFLDHRAAFEQARVGAKKEEKQDIKQVFSAFVMQREKNQPPPDKVVEELERMKWAEEEKPKAGLDLIKLSLTGDKPGNLKVVITPVNVIRVLKLTPTIGEMVAQASPEIIKILQEKFKAYGKIIACRLRYEQLRREKVSIDREFKQAHDTILHEQPARYFREDNNDKTPGLWTRSWLEKLLAISIDTKHVRLTPTGMMNKTTQVMGSFAWQQTRVLIDYVEPNFYPWAIMGLLRRQLKPDPSAEVTTAHAVLCDLFPSNPVVNPLILEYYSDSKLGVLDSEIMSASRAFIQFLKDHKYLERPKHSQEADKQNVKHPLAFAYLNAKKAEQKAREDRDEKQLDSLQEQTQDCRQRFMTQLRQDLENQKSNKNLQFLLPHVEVLGNFLLDRVLQLSQLQLTADTHVDLEQLLSDSLRGTVDLVTSFADGLAAQRVKHTGYEHKAIPVKVSKVAVVPIEEQKRQFAFLLVEVTKDCSAQNLAKLHRCLDYLVKDARTQGDYESVYACYEKTSSALFAYADKQHCADIEALGLVYARKALRLACLCLRDSAATSALALNLAARFAQQKLWQESWLCLGQVLGATGAINENELIKQRLVYVEALEKQCQQVDDDIYAQWSHAKLQVQELFFITLRIAAEPGNRELHYKAQNLLADIVVKLRQSLEQSFARFVYQRLHLPNNNFEPMTQDTTIKFHLYSDLQEMRKKLADKKIFEEKGKESLAYTLDHPAYQPVLMALKEVQPFNEDKKATTWTGWWLEPLIELSNQMKHIRLSFLSEEQLQHRLAESIDFARFYQIGCQSKRLYPASFSAELGSLVDSKELVLYLNDRYLTHNKGFYYIKKGSLVDRVVCGLPEKRTEDREKLIAEMKAMPPLQSKTLQQIAKVADKLLATAQNNNHQETGNYYVELIPFLQASVAGVEKLMNVFFQAIRAPLPPSLRASPTSAAGTTYSSSFGLFQHPASAKNPGSVERVPAAETKRTPISRALLATPPAKHSVSSVLNAQRQQAGLHLAPATAGVPVVVYGSSQSKKSEVSTAPEMTL